jgi:hypothetical protein
MSPPRFSSGRPPRLCGGGAAHKVQEALHGIDRVRRPLVVHHVEGVLGARQFGVGHWLGGYPAQRVDERPRNQRPITGSDADAVAQLINRLALTDRARSPLSVAWTRAFSAALLSGPTASKLAKSTA